MGRELDNSLILLLLSKTDCSFSLNFIFLFTRRETGLSEFFRFRGKDIGGKKFSLRFLSIIVFTPFSLPFRSNGFSYADKRDFVGVRVSSPVE